MAGDTQFDSQIIERQVYDRLTWVMENYQLVRGTVVMQPQPHYLFPIDRDYYTLKKEKENYALLY